MDAYPGSIVWESDLKVNPNPRLTDIEITSDPRSGSDSDTYGSREVIEFTVTFDVPVTVTGDATEGDVTLRFFIGEGEGLLYEDVEREADLRTGDGTELTEQLVFTYTVVSLDNASGGIFVRPEGHHTLLPFELVGDQSIEGRLGRDAKLDTFRGRRTYPDHMVNGTLRPPPAARPPQDLRAFAGNLRLDVEWDEPSAGAPANGYRVRWRKSADTGFAASDTANVATGTEYNISDLSDGEAYVVQVASLNASSDPGDWVETQATVGRPKAVANLTVATRRLDFRVSWDAPTERGEGFAQDSEDDPVLVYRVSWTRQGQDADPVQDPDPVQYQKLCQTGTAIFDFYEYVDGRRSGGSVSFDQAHPNDGDVYDFTVEARFETDPADGTPCHSQTGYGASSAAAATATDTAAAVTDEDHAGALAALESVVATHEAQQPWLRTALTHTSTDPGTVEAADLPRGTRGEVDNVNRLTSGGAELSYGTANMLRLDIDWDLQSPEALTYTAVHELAHVWTLDSTLHGAASRQAVGEALLYFFTQNYDDSDKTEPEQAQCAVETLADAIAHEAVSPGALSYYGVDVCFEDDRLEPSDDDEELALHAMHPSGTTPGGTTGDAASSWLDTTMYTSDDASADAWADVEAIVATGYRALVMNLLQDSFGGYCSISVANTAAFDDVPGFPASDVTDPWQDGGCEPEAPTGVMVSEPNNADVISVSWTAPKKGGAPITGYRVEWRTTTQTWAQARHQIVAATPLAAMFDADPSEQYVARVRAINSIGHGDWSPGAAQRADADADAPTIESVEVTSEPKADSRDGDQYGTGEDITFEVTFSEAVNVTGEVTFAFQIGSGAGAERQARLQSGSGTDTLVFVYITETGDDDADGIFIGDGAATFNLGAGQSITGVDSGGEALLAHDSPGTLPGHKVNDSLNSANALLSALSLSGITLDQEFSPTRFNYTATSNESQTTVTPTTAASSATADAISRVPLFIETGGLAGIPTAADADPAPGHQVDLEAGILNRILIIVASQNSSIRRIYQVDVTRPAGTARALPPQNVRAAADSGTVTLSWDAPDGDPVTGYRIERRRADLGPSDRGLGDDDVLVGDTGSAGTVYVDDTVEPGVDYQYRVAAIGPDGTGQASGWVRAEPDAAVEANPNNPATGSPTIRGTAQVGRTLTADITGISDADGVVFATFAYQWVSSDGTTDTDIEDATDPTYELVAADQGRSVKVRLTFTDGGGNEETLTSAPTEPVLGDGLPGAPRNLTATAGNKEVSLSWEPPADNGNAPATRYRIEWRIDGKDYSKSQWGTSRSTTYTTTDQANLANGVTYVFRVKAENGSGYGHGPYGPSSEEVGATPTSGSAVDLSTPVLSEPEVLHEGMVRLDWQDIEGAGWYVVQYYHLKGGEWLDLPAAGVDVAFHGSSAVVSNVDGLSWLRVRAMSCAGESEWSQIEQLLLDNPSQWEGVPVPEVENGDKIEPCSEDADTPDNSLATEKTPTSPATGAADAQPDNSPAAGAVDATPDDSPAAGAVDATPDDSPAAGAVDATPDDSPAAGAVDATPDDSPAAGAVDATPDDSPAAGAVDATPDDSPAAGAVDATPDDSPAAGAVVGAQPTEPPAKPRGLSATASHNSVTLTWDAPGVDSITGYVILRRVRENDAGGDFSELVPDTSTAATTYTDDTVVAGITYTYRIKAINEYGVSERSRWFHIDTPAAPVPDQPTG